MANKKIIDLDTGTPEITSYLESTQVDSNEPTGRKSVKINHADLGNWIAGQGQTPLQYGGLKTNAKTPIGGINELNDWIYSLLPIASADGAIASFTTDYALPLVSGKFDIDYSANGYTGMNISHSGKNLIDPNSLALRPVTSGGVLRGAYAPLTLDAGTYTLSYVGNYGMFITNVTNNYSYIQSQSSPTSFTLTNKSVILIRYASDDLSIYNTNVQLEKNSTATTYEAYTCTPHAISWQTEAGTIYGGYFDSVSGILTSTKASDGTDLSTPVEYQLEPESIMALLGTNNIWCDTNGDSEVKFKESIQKYIDDQIAEVQALVLN